jgi:signal transduction histidine kinase
MASENPLLLFQARPAEKAPPLARSSASASFYPSRDLWPLVHALAATLDNPNGLPSLVEVLGTHLGAKACLLLCHYPSPDPLIYTLWQRGEPPTITALGSSTANSPTDQQRQAALELIQQAAAAGQGRLPWQQGLAKLLRDEEGCPPTWLRSLESCSAIAIDGPELRGAVLILGNQGLVDPAVQAHIASLGAIACYQHHLNAQGQRHSDQLRHLNSLKDDFLSTLNHELRTPLTSMMLAIRMLRRPDLTPERSAMYLDILEQQCAREIDLVNDLLMLQALEAGPVTRQAVDLRTFDLGALLGDLVTQWRPGFERSQVCLDLRCPPDPVTVSTDPDRLGKVLRELLENAHKYSAPRTTVEVSLEPGQPNPGQITLRVTNQGAAIAPEELPHIFDRFRRGRNATRDGVAGTGTGLALVHRLVSQLGGTVSATSQPGEDQLWQTQFTVMLKAPGAFP